MQSKATTVDQYINELPPERIEPMKKLRETIVENLPTGFVEEMGYGMIGYVVPHEIYPGGYHCNPKLPVPFANIASQKNSITFYHMGIYGNPEFLNWFVGEYNKLYKTKLDMGKGCMRFKKFDEIPYELIGKLMRKMSVKMWLEHYAKMDPRNKKI